MVCDKSIFDALGKGMLLVIRVSCQSLLLTLSEFNQCSVPPKVMWKTKGE